MLPVFVAFGQIASGSPREPTPVRIEFEAPSGCSSVDAFFEGVHGRTDRVRWALEGESAVQIRIKLFRAGTKIKGELRLSDQEGEKETRKVDGATCDEVVEALSLTVTLALDPNALLASRKSTEPAASDANNNGGIRAAPPASVPSTVGDKIGDQPKTSSQVSASLSGIRSELGAQLVAASVVSRSVSFGGALSFKLIVPSSAIGQWSAGATLLHVQNDLLKSASWAVFSLTALALDVCPLRYGSKRADAELCGVATGGWLHGSGVVDHPDSVGRSWWSLGLRAATSMQLVGALRLGLRVGAEAPIFRREFFISEPAQQVGHTPYVAVSGGLGLSLRF
jgi:hypothetical protein